MASFRRRLVWAAIAVGLGAVALFAASVAPASVARAGGWKVQKSPDVGGSSETNFLDGVAATSPTNAWAVGDYFNGTLDQTLVEHWHGKAWKVQNSPNVGGSTETNALHGVAATSSTNAWAVGYSEMASVQQTLVEHWNGKAWKVQNSPNPSTQGNVLWRVAATSSRNAWAVGSYYNGTANQTLVEHWNGKAWKVQKSPNPGGSTEDNELLGIAATSSTNAWAVGWYFTATAQVTLIEHWNGKAWKVQRSRNPGGPDGESVVASVAATSPANAWAVGSYQTASASPTLVEHWNGKAWRVQKSPDPSGGGYFQGVAATSPGNAWAVGAHGAVDQTLIAHWNGRAWKVQPTPDPGGSGHDNYFESVAATSPTNAWAVGSYNNGTVGQTLIEHRS